MNSAALDAVLAVVITALAWLTPSLTNTTLPFGVRVPAERADAAVILEQRARYRWLVGVGGLGLTTVWTALAATVGFALPGVLPLVVSAMCLAAFGRARTAIVSVKRDEDWYRGLRQGVVTDTSLRTEPGRFPWLWSIPALLTVVGTAVTGVVAYPSLPGRFPVHFDAAGHADHYATKSFGSVFTPVFVQVGATAFLLAVSWFAFRARPELDPARPVDSAHRHRRFSVRAVVSVLLLAACANLSMFVAAWSMWHAGSLSPVLVLLPLLIGLAIVVGIALRTGQAGSRLPEAQDAVREPDTGMVQRDDDRYWHAAGSVYINRADPSLLVQKRSGFGWTFNFGNPRALLVFVLLIGVPLLLPLIVH
jgi:uncharacterized membrane protein